MRIGCGRCSHFETQKCGDADALDRKAFGLKSPRRFVPSELVARGCNAAQLSCSHLQATCYSSG